MKRTLISLIQDRSGSMSSVWEETLSGFKTYIESMQADQKKDNEVEYIFSLTAFDTQIDVPYKGVPIADVDVHILKQYGPRGSTALYDAVGKTLQALDDDKGLTFDKAIVVIVTDGKENSSREWSKDALHAAIDERVKRGNWTFTYLGTQPETWDDAQSLGMGMGASATYNAKNAGATYATIAYASANMARSGQGQSVSFLHDNTTAAMRCAVGMKTATDDDSANLVGVTTSTQPVPTAAPAATPHRSDPPKRNSTGRRWK
ncbi:MAG TPA: vWA domain-containing protein [Candidatus Acidoferrales bacterium]|nr:vWA domain-containing protein [Candidatus Acidoferrales bacterium]